ncbi:MAG: site-2 protease family protein [Patescibacteria group bacterium]|jgi:Zn-dependent protease
MLNLLSQNPLMFFIALIVLVCSIGVHEFAHALVADKLGDPTPRAKGRLTLNPLAHVDMVGMMFILFWGFGWGKPVPYDPFNLRKPSRDAALIALAGPVASLLFALLGAILLRMIPNAFIQTVAAYVILLNVTLGIFNLVPLSPLDGFQVVAGILPAEKRAEWLSLSRYGILVLLLFLLPIVNGQSPLFILIQPAINFLLGFMIPGGIM